MKAERTASAISTHARDGVQLRRSQDGCLGCRAHGCLLIHTTIRKGGMQPSREAGINAGKASGNVLGVATARRSVSGPDFTPRASLTKTNGRATMLRHVLNAGGRAAVSASRPQRYVPLGVNNIMAASEGRSGERTAVEVGVSPEAAR